MKKQILRFGPWLLLMAIGTIAVPRTANTAPCRSIRICARRRMSCARRKMSWNMRAG